VAEQPAPLGSAGEVFRVFLRLGLTSFGGPVAHIGYFRAEFVERRRWLDEHGFVDLVALTQFLPGPASSELGIAIGLMRAGAWGALCAWLGFTLPSALAMIAFGYGVSFWGDLADAPWLHGLKIVACAVVAQAVWGMARSLAPDRARMSMAVIACAVTLALPTTAGQLGCLIAAGLFGWAFLAESDPAAAAPLPFTIGRGWAAASLALYVALLVILPLFAASSTSHAIALVDSFYRTGALVFGGGHVVLPLLQAEIVPRGWLGNDAFLAGYGAAQAVPGPLFTFAAYLGTVMEPAPRGWIGGLLCLAAIFLPSFLLVAGTIPFWNALRGNRALAAALRGINAAVVGILLAALYQPVWTGAILGPKDFALGLAAFVLLMFWRTPPWLVVVLGALGAELLALFG
jgi:chromate transporter